MSLENFIRDLAKETGLDTFVNTVFGIPRQKATADIDQILKQPNWSSANFRHVLHHSAFGNLRLSQVPDSIDIQSLVVTINRLVDKSKDGKEYGRIAYIRLQDKRLEMGSTYQGDQSSCSIGSEIPNQTIFNLLTHRPAVMIHTHPVDDGENHSAHFSPTDFKSFLEASNINASIVAFGTRKLMLLKTARTPEFSTEIGNTIDDFLKAAKAEVSVKSATQAARFTKNIAKHLHLALYYAKPEEPNVVKLVIHK